MMSNAATLPSMLQAGLQAQARGDLAAAERLLAQVAEQAPRQAQAWFALGNVREDLQRLAEAEVCYRRTAELMPGLAEAHYNQARMLQRLGRGAEARVAIAQALRCKPGAANMLQLRAMLEEEAGDLAAALQSLDAAIAAAPERAALHHNRAVVLQRQQQHALSLAAHERAQALGLDVADAHYNHGNTLRSLGRDDEALAAYRRALARDPQHGLALYDLARLRWNAGDADFAAELRAAEAAAPASATAAGIHARLLLNAERHAEAVELFRRAIARAPAASGYHDGLGLALSRLGRHEEALAAHEQAVRLAPADPTARSNHAHSLLAAGRPAEAAAQAEAALALAPQDQHVLALLGLAWRALGDPREPWLNDYARLVRVFDLPAPDGFADMEAFNAALAAELTRRHTDRRAPIDQSLREGTQTRGNLLDEDHPLIVALRRRLAEAIDRYVAELPVDAEHPFLRRRGSGWRFTDSWSSRLRSTGFHTNHVHAHGWLSSCYYVALPAAVDRQGPAGWIKFGEPDLDLGLAPQRIEQPRAGRLVLFPSCFWHGTVPFDDGGMRLTVAFDVKPLP
ncbi:tetratricopeptide repeat protein [Roseateles violae]|uniref:Tetratricopeptide repeat protein n=1 Tax=Roseateles violae TaxID=3058042 RepID=A0ABT8DZU6_9BURK|nr:tetratricopeptide repeat protein [Pelomonas sp. PFR6]MDN3923117.1 tetratricopeptide repeat protein [Pelomonas sp. PFR6]